MILKNKDKIMEHMKSVVLMMSIIIWKKRGKATEMEKRLNVWMQDPHWCRVPLSLMLIQEKAKSLYEDLKKKHGEESEGTYFNASHGWFHWFKARANLHNVEVSSEAASIYLSRFLMWMRQNCTGRGCQTEVTSVRRKS